MLSEVVLDHPGARVCLMDSITKVTAADAGSLLVSASHGGTSSAEFALVHPGRVVMFNDAGGGKEGAGTAALGLLQRAGVACCTISHDSARIGDARDQWESGVISGVNAVAEALGFHRRSGPRGHRAVRPEPGPGADRQRSQILMLETPVAGLGREREQPTCSRQPRARSRRLRRLQASSRRARSFRFPVTTTRTSRRGAPGSSMSKSSTRTSPGRCASTAASRIGSPGRRHPGVAGREPRYKLGWARGDRGREHVGAGVAQCRPTAVPDRSAGLGAASPRPPVRCQRDPGTDGPLPSPPDRSRTRVRAHDRDDRQAVGRAHPRRHSGDGRRPRPDGAVIRQGRRTDGRSGPQPVRESRRCRPCRDRQGVRRDRTPSHVRPKRLRRCRPDACPA